MNRIGELKAELQQRWPRNAVTELCYAIIEAMSTLPHEQMQMLTFSSFVNLTHRERIDEELIRAIGLLANTSLHALDSKFLFYDEFENAFEIEKQQLSEARESGVFVHPETGEPIEDFEGRIVPFFFPSDKFKKLAAEA